MCHFVHQPSEGATGDGTGTSEGGGEGSETGKRQQSQKNTFIIAGSVAGGILLIALILLILWRCNSPKYVLLQFCKLILTVIMQKTSINFVTDNSSEFKIHWKTILGALCAQK